MVQNKLDDKTGQALKMKSIAETCHDK